MKSFFLFFLEILVTLAILLSLGWMVMKPDKRLTDLSPETGDLPPYVHWDIRYFPECKIPLSINEAGAADIPGDAEFAAIQSAVNTWNNAGAEIGIQVQPNTSQASVGYDSLLIITWDGGLDSNLAWFPAADDTLLVPLGTNVGAWKKVVGFGNDNKCNTVPVGDDMVFWGEEYALVFVLGTGSEWKGPGIYSGPNGKSESMANNGNNPANTLIWMIESSGIICHSDIILNDRDFDWNMAQQKMDNTSRVDVETVVLHELGHFLGLGHAGAVVGTVGPVMCGERYGLKRSLSKDDQMGLQFLNSPDLGDAPDPWWADPGKYPSLIRFPDPDPVILNGVQMFLPGNGAMHLYGRQKFEHLGLTSDGECESEQVNRDAADNGVLATPFINGQIANLVVTITYSRIPGRYQNGNPEKLIYLNAWVDWNIDGDWEDPGEKIIDEPGILPANPPAGWVLISGKPVLRKVFQVMAPPNFPAEVGVWARFRLDYGEDVGDVANINGDLDQDKGVAQFGEVEDYFYPGFRILMTPDEDETGGAFSGGFAGEEKEGSISLMTGSVFPLPIHNFFITATYDSAVIEVLGGAIVHPGFAPYSNVALMEDMVILSAQLPQTTGCDNIEVLGKEQLLTINYRVRDTARLFTTFPFSFVGDFYSETYLTDPENCNYVYSLDTSVLYEDIFQVLSPDDDAPTAEIVLADTTYIVPELEILVSDGDGSGINPWSFSIYADADVYGQLSGWESSSFELIPAGQNLFRSFTYDEEEGKFRLEYPMQFLEGWNTLTVAIADQAGNVGTNSFSFLTTGALNRKEPASFELHQNYPNPFSDETTVSFFLPGKQHITLSVYSLKGDLLKIIADREYSGGPHSFSWKSDLPSGVYFLQLATPVGKRVRKIVVIQ